MSREKVEIHKEKCKSCLYCIEFCPKKVISLSKKPNIKGYFYAEFEDRGDACTSCALCAVMCPEACIEIYKKENN